MNAGGSSSLLTMELMRISAAWYYFDPKEFSCMIGMSATQGIIESLIFII